MFLSQSVSLGSIQTVYAAFLNSLNDYRNYKELNYYPQKIISQQEQLTAQKEYYYRIMDQLPVVREQYHTSKSIFNRDSVLFTRNVISQNEYEVSKNSFLQSKQAYLSFNASLKQSELQIMEGEESLLDLQQQASELESKYRLSLHNATEALNAQIRAWVVPFGEDRPRGKAMLPVQGAGKVSAGQRVNVRINNFPDQEFYFTPHLSDH